MLHKTYLYQLLLPRLSEATGRLENQIWEPVGGPYPVSQSEPTRQHVPVNQLSKKEFKPINSLPFTWGSRFDQCWWQMSDELIRDLNQYQGELFLDWRDDAEATLYADGIPWHGIDPGHPFIPLPDEAADLKIESACVRSGVWVPGNMRKLPENGSVFKGAYTLKRNEDAWQSWLMLDLLKEFIDHSIHKIMPEHLSSGGSAGHRPGLDRIDPLIRRLLDKVDRAIDILDTKGAAAFKVQLDKVLDDFKSANKSFINCVLTGHAHIDLVWLWPERVGEFKAIHTFSTMNRLMEKYPEFRFGYSQPASYEAVGKRSPELLEQVRKQINSGKWEAEGGSYVEADTQLPCGENLVRGFLLGQKGFKELTGKLSSILWLPDVFGYSGCMPQIMAQTGVSRFFTTKLTWCSISRFPHSSFRWAGYDGTEVLVHVTQAYGYNGCVSIKEIDDGQLHYQQAGVHDAYLAPIGWGDGGGGPTDVMCERARLLNDFAGMPKTQWGRIDEFFNQLDKVRDKLPVFQGELYMEYHRGVQTTHGDLKAAFRSAERALQTLEAVHCVLKTGSIDQELWKRLVIAQFHDYIPGSSIKEVYQEAIPELLKITETALEASQAALDATDNDSATAVFNPLPFSMRIFDTKSATWKCLPPLSGDSIECLDALQGIGPVSASETGISNDRVQARFDEFGRVKELSIDSHKIPFMVPAGELVLYPDHPHAFDAWDIDRHVLANPQPVITPAEVSFSLSDDGHSGMVSFSRAIGQASRITTHYKLDAQDCVLRIEYDVDWKDPKCLLKVVFPTDYRGRHARYAAPFGSTLRVQQPARPDDEAQFENPFSRWIEVGDDSGDCGFHVVTESKYGATVFNGSVQISLLRSVFITALHSDRPKEDLLDPANYSDLKNHSIKMAIGRFGPESPSEERAAALADLLYTNAIQYSGNKVDCGFMGIEGMATFLPCWTKPSESDVGAIVVRCHETNGQRGNIKINLKPGYNATAVDLMEKPLPSQADSQCSHEVKPYSIISFKIEPDQ